MRRCRSCPRDWSGGDIGAGHRGRLTATAIATGVRRRCSKPVNDVVLAHAAKAHHWQMVYLLYEAGLASDLSLLR